MGAMVEDEVENWRDKEESLVFAVLDVVFVEARVRNDSVILCMRRVSKRVVAARSDEALEMRE
jgi:hypothetical protein